MNLLIDTHVLVWWNDGGDLLNTTVCEALADGGNDVFVSVASIWELAIKRAKGKFKLEMTPSMLVARNGFSPLTIMPHHAETAAALDWHHTDPFDRMLVAQAQLEGLTLVHADGVTRQYAGVSQLWAR